ncbi:hydroxymethylpyrimidine/phosphomethylpyrimidine kinase [Marinilabiliaceae bacterium JC017]|nr:hydroxymethylpyrimidine/phosphomethylpyrimidine kinase [Marinilabiliaceae bacterium JC017]
MGKSSAMRPVVLSIAGFDPSGGAGILADIKTLESFCVYGMAVLSANTIQNDTAFQGVSWVPVEEIIQQLEVLNERFTPVVVKIGLIENMDVFTRVTQWVKTNWPAAFFIWDPIIKASAGYTFHEAIPQHVLNNVDLVTPNVPEYQLLCADTAPALMASQTNCHILLKGGHASGTMVKDVLYQPDGVIHSVTCQRIQDVDKHGTGCVLSSAIAAGVALGNNLSAACNRGHLYIRQLLESNPGLLGYHNHSQPELNPKNNSL